MKRYAVALGAFSFFCVSGAMAATESATLATGTNTDKIIHAKKVQDKLAKTKAREASHNPSLFDEYLKVKNEIQNAMNMQYSLDISLMPQWGFSKGGKTSYQTIYAPTVNWDIFSSDKFGDGSVQFSYNAVQYWSKANGSSMGANLALANVANDYTDNSDSFDQLSYTHTTVGDMFSLTVGQYPMYTFDGGTYNSNQQINFINYALSQNASSTYPTASLGAYVEFNPNSEWSFAAGLQDANNVSGSRINFKTLDDGDYTGFGYFSYSPVIEGLGSGQYTFLYYYQPSVTAQPEKSQGWSFNATQNIGDKWAVFGRLNGSSGDIVPVKTSVVLGAAYLNPLNRNPLDQIGFAVAYNDINKNAVTPAEGTKVRGNETVLEAYWTWGFSKWLQITPDVQFYINPALDTKKSSATVLSLRATLMF